MVKWYHKSLPSLRCGFDSRYPLQLAKMPLKQGLKSQLMLRLCAIACTFITPYLYYDEKIAPDPEKSEAFLHTHTSQIRFEKLVLSKLQRLIADLIKTRARRLRCCTVHSGSVGFKNNSGIVF
jgi:hypothetical protein